MTLDFKVHEQTLEGIPTTSVPRDKSQNYIKLRFHFDKSWDLFKENGAHITVYCQDKKADPAVSTPTIIYETDDWTLTLQDYYASLDDFLIMVVGVSADGTVSCPTNALCVTLDKSGTAWTLNPESPDDPAYVQLLAEVGAAIAEVEGDLAKKENAYINIQEYYDAWIAEHPSGDVSDFIKTLADVGKYTFSDYDSEYYYELKDAAQSDEGHRYYGLLEAYDGGTANIIRYVYCGETVADLARETDVELVDKKYLTDNHYVSATVSAAPTGTEMQEVYKSAAGKLVTPAGGGGGTTDHAQLTNRDAAGQHPISAITGLQTALDGKLASVPQADSTTLGGIKAAARDASTDTQEIKIGTDGKLYTTPESVMIVNADYDSVTHTIYNIGKTFEAIEAAYNGLNTSKKAVFLHAGNIELELKQFVYDSQGRINYDVAVFVATIGQSTFLYTMYRRADFSSLIIYKTVGSISEESTNQETPTALAVYNYVNAAIGDTASQLTALDNLIGGDSE